MEPFWIVLQCSRDVWQLPHEPSQSKRLCIMYVVKDFLVRRAVKRSCYRVLCVVSDFCSKLTFQNMMPACKTGMSVRGCRRREREQESLLIPVCAGAESQLTEAWTPATISKGGSLLLLANRKRVLSVSMWAYSCITVCAFPWKVSVGVHVFRLQISAAYFQPPIFSSVTLVVYVEERREEERERAHNGQ